MIQLKIFSAGSLSLSPSLSHPPLPHSLSLFPLSLPCPPPLSLILILILSFPFLFLSPATSLSSYLPLFLPPLSLCYLWNSSNLTASFLSKLTKMKCVLPSSTRKYFQTDIIMAKTERNMDPAISHKQRHLKTNKLVSYLTCSVF